MMMNSCTGLMCSHIFCLVFCFFNVVSILLYWNIRKFRNGMCVFVNFDVNIHNMLMVFVGWYDCFSVHIE